MASKLGHITIIFKLFVLPIMASKLGHITIFHNAHCADFYGIKIWPYYFKTIPA